MTAPTSGAQGANGATSAWEKALALKASPRGVQGEADCRQGEGSRLRVELVSLGGGARARGALSTSLKYENCFSHKMMAKWKSVMRGRL